MCNEEKVQLDEMKSCMLCSRRCGIDRSRGQTGYCGMTDRVVIARAALHMWEEPCISGTRGSGAVFFSGCSLRCVFCQNNKIANGKVGQEVSIEQLARIFIKLQGEHANNINLVTATHYIPQVAEAIRLSRDNGLSIPIIYNTGSYESVSSLRLLDGLVDVYLPDMKYIDTKISIKYSNAPDYATTAKAGIEEMFRQTGEPKFASANERIEEGSIKKGVIVRHMALPGCHRDSQAVIKYLYETYKNKIYISILNQYTPLREIEDRYPEIARGITKREYEHLVDYALDLGIENGFIQEGDTIGESFIPDFSDHVLEGIDDGLDKI